MEIFLRYHVLNSSVRVVFDQTTFCSPEPLCISSGGLRVTDQSSDYAHSPSIYFRLFIRLFIWRTRFFVIDLCYVVWRIPMSCYMTDVLSSKRAQLNIVCSGSLHTSLHTSPNLCVFAMVRKKAFYFIFLFSHISMHSAPFYIHRSSFQMVLGQNIFTLRLRHLLGKFLILIQIVLTTLQHIEHEYMKFKFKFLGIGSVSFRP